MNDILSEPQQKSQTSSETLGVFGKQDRALEASG